MKDPASKFILDESYEEDEYDPVYISSPSISYAVYDSIGFIDEEFDPIFHDDDISRNTEVKMLFTILEARCESDKSTIVCSQREPKSWASMILNDEVSANAIIKRATKHYTVVINVKEH